MSGPTKVIIQQLEQLHPLLARMSGANLPPAPTFAAQWLEQENAGVFYLSIPDHEDRPAMIFGVFGLLLLNQGRRAAGAALLKEAIGLLEKHQDHPSARVIPPEPGVVDER